MQQEEEMRLRKKEWLQIGHFKQIKILTSNISIKKTKIIASKYNTSIFMYGAKMMTMTKADGSQLKVAERQIY